MAKSKSGKSRSVVPIGTQLDARLVDTLDDNIFGLKQDVIGAALLAFFRKPLSEQTYLVQMYRGFEKNREESVAVQGDSRDR